LHRSFLTDIIDASIGLLASGPLKSGAENKPTIWFSILQESVMIPVLNDTNEDENVCSQTSSQISNVRFASEAESRSGSRTTNDFELLAMPMFASVSDRFR
jgi:hypothetical protein